ncbi:MAG: gamma-glutamyl-gamma-aminobutyrate hydrolase family protein [Holosporales bacterium]
MPRSAPKIGIVLDHDTRPTYAAYPWYALRENYVTALENHGGIPFLIPYCPAHLEAYLDMVHGILIPGGDHDIHPERYEDPILHPKTCVKTNRTDFEFVLTEAALQRGLPIFGICGGMQLINVIFGGSLHQHLPEDLAGEIAHQQTLPKHQVSHAIEVASQSLLWQLNDHESAAMVNSTHHQGLKKLGQGLLASAHAPDGLIEAVEHPDHRFCVGVQWHPEYQTTALDRALFKAFVGACRS